MGVHIIDAAGGLAKEAVEKAVVMVVEKEAVVMQDEYASDMMDDGGMTWVLDELRLESGRLMHRVPVRKRKQHLHRIHHNYTSAELTDVLQ